MRLGMHTYSLYHHGVAEDWAGFTLPWGLKFTGAAVGEGDLDMKQAYALIRSNPHMNRINIELDLECPLDSMEAAMACERDALQRSIAYCRNVLGIC